MGSDFLQTNELFSNDLFMFASLFGNLLTFLSSKHERSPQMSEKLWGPSGRQLFHLSFGNLDSPEGCFPVTHFFPIKLVSTRQSVCEDLPSEAEGLGEVQPAHLLPL